MLELQVETIRRHLTGIVRELDHRRHDLADVRGQVRRQLREHQPELMAAGATTAMLVGGVAVAALFVRRHRRRPEVRARRRRRAMARLLDHPERIARNEPSIVVKVAGAVLAAVTASVARSLMDGVVAEIEHRPPKQLQPWEALNPPASR